MKSQTLLAVVGFIILVGPVMASPLTAVGVSAPADLTQGEQTVALTPSRTIVAGDVISVGARGKVALQFAGAGMFTLSSLGDLQVFEATGARGRQPALAKLKLLAGALRVDSRASNGKPAQDVRLNIGSLKTRITNAHAWAANTAEGDTLCLLAGALSMQTDGTGEERLTQAGSCLRREPDGQLSRFALESDAVVVGAIDATRFQGDLNPRSAAAVANTSTPIIAGGKLPETEIAVVPANGRAEAPPVPDADSRGWTVVVLSLSRPDAVATHAQALAEQGLPATTRQAMVRGMTMHRVAVGSFGSQAEARAYAASTLAQRGIKGWPAPL